MKKLIAHFKGYIFSAKALVKKVFKKKANQRGYEEVLFV